MCTWCSRHALSPDKDHEGNKKGGSQVHYSETFCILEPSKDSSTESNKDNDEVEKFNHSMEEPQNNQNRKTEMMKMNEKVITAEYFILFDVFNVSALDMIVIQEYIEFLISQREPSRRGHNVQKGEEEG